MKLILKTEFDSLRLIKKHQFEVDTNREKQVVNVFYNALLIAKKLKNR